MSAAAKRTIIRSKAFPRCRAAIGAKGGKGRPLSSGSGDGGTGSGDSSDWEKRLTEEERPRRKGAEVWQSLLSEPSSSSRWKSRADPPTEGDTKRSSTRGDGALDDLDPTSETASRQQRGVALWQALLKSPSKSTSSTWDFLPDLMEGDTKRPQSRFTHPSASSSSYRRLQDGGVDFLQEDYQQQQPARPLKESASEEDPGSGIKSLLHASSFKLLRDSLISTESTDADKKVVGDTLGMDASHFFSQSKELDHRSLREVEQGASYGTAGGSFLESKSYTYEELGEKLRKLRPPTEQILSSPTGLSFGELQRRILSFVEEGNDEQIKEFRVLKNSFQQLKTFGPTDVKKQLTYAELAFVNSSGVKFNSQERIEYVPPNDDLLTKYYSETQLSSKERLKLKIKNLKEEFQTHEYDTGSPQVQIAILTARINNLNRHMREGPNAKRDKHSKKGLNEMVHYRKRLLRYLRRRDWPVYCNVLTKLKLDDVILEKRR